mmetsp:Transcript_5243/g.14855  ORF Transcript_5243/g.14855 Transcript_5243/m.14855 type:complete len:82 (-) Transcript_5243:77-322(-)
MCSETPKIAIFVCPTHCFAASSATLAAMEQCQLVSELASFFSLLSIHSCCCRPSFIQHVKKVLTHGLYVSICQRLWGDCLI